MANPTPLPRTSGLARFTVDDIELFVARILGIDPAEFTANESALMLDFINREVNEWRVQVKSTKPYGQEEIVYEWGGIEAHDPASGDTKFELPANFGELQEQKVFYVGDDETVPDLFAPVISIEEFRGSFFEGENFRYTDATPVAYIYQESDNRQRIMGVYPTPKDGTKVNVPYWAEADQVTTGTDVIEADPDVHDGIRYGVAARWVAVDGDDQAIARWERLRNRQWQLFSNRAAREDKRQRFARPFSGYPGVTDTPDRQFVDRRFN